MYIYISPCIMFGHIQGNWNGKVWQSRRIRPKTQSLFTLLVEKRGEKTIASWQSFCHWKYWQENSQGYCSKPFFDGGFRKAEPLLRSVCRRSRSCCWYLWKLMPSLGFGCWGSSQPGQETGKPGGPAASVSPGCIGGPFAEVFMTSQMSLHHEGCRNWVQLFGL